MTDTFSSLLSDPWVGVRFLLKIQGIGDVFLDGPTPVKQNGSNWSAETSKSHNYTYREHMLDLSGSGLRDIGQQITRAAGFTSPGQMTLTLMDDRNGYLRTLFSTAHEDTQKEILGANLAHDTTGAGSVITCEETISGWTATGFAYLGRETIYYPVISGSAFGTGGNKCTRDIFSIGSCDTSYTINANSNQAPRIISSTPTVWHGRYVQLFAYLVDREGRTLGDDLTTMSREVFRGIIQGPPLPDDSYSAFSINCRSIDSVLHTSVGLEPVEGELVRVMGTAKANSEGNAFGFEGEGDFIPIYFITDATRYVHIRLSTAKNFVHDFDVEIFSDGKIVSPDIIKAEFNTAVNAAVQAQTAKNFDEVNFELQTWSKLGKKKGVFRIVVDSTYAPHAKWGAPGSGGDADADGLTVHIDWDRAGSIGPLLGFSGVWTDSLPLDSSGDLTMTSKWDTYTAAIISPYDTKIPFFYKGHFGLDGQTAPASGYVRIGDEIIKYESIDSSDNDFIEGMHCLIDCTRGWLGTQPEEHRIEYTNKGLAVGERKDVKFLNYFGTDTGGVSFLDIILQLSVSTGSAHHGAFDTLSQYVGPAIAPGHFDVDAFASIKASMLDDEHHIRWWFDKPVKLMDIASKWLQPLGLFLTAKTNAAGDYKITVTETLPPLEGEALQEFAQANIDATSPASWQATSKVINEVICRYNWDPGKGDNTEDYVVVRETDSISDYGTKGRITWNLLGYQYDYSKAIHKVHRWAARAFARYGRPADLLEVVTDRTGWLVNPGDVVLITMAGPPNTSDGTRIYQDRAVRVLGVSHSYHQPGGQPGAVLTVILENVLRYSSYSPSASIRSVASAVMTLNANDYTTANVSTDVAHFEVGDYVTIFNIGAGAVTDERHIDSISGNNVTLNSGLTNVTHDATRTKMVASQWDNANVTANQRKHVFISTLTSVGSYSLTPFKYV